MTALFWATLWGCGGGAPAPVVDPVPPGWHWITDHERRFEVALPMLPERSMEAGIFETKAGNVEVASYITRVDTDAGELSLTVRTYPSGIVGMIGAKAMVDNAMEELANGATFNPQPWRPGDAMGYWTEVDGGRLGAATFKDDLLLLRATDPKSADIFLRSLSLKLALHAPTVSLGGTGATVKCPSRCGPIGPPPAGESPRLGVQGVLDTIPYAAFAVPHNRTEAVNAQVALAASRDRLTGIFPGDVVEEQDFKVGEEPGRRLHIRHDGQEMRSRTVVLSGHAVTAYVIVPAEREMPWADRFVASLSYGG